MIAFHPSRAKVEVAEVGARAARDFVQRVGKLWQGELYTECGPDCSLVPETQVTVYIAASSADQRLNWTTDESYTLDIATKGV